MKLICRIEDEERPNPWDEVLMDRDVMTLDSLTVSDLLAEDYSVWLSKSRGFGFDIEIEGVFKEDTKTVHQKNINPVAIDSLASFCQQFINFYNKLNNGSDN